MKSRIRPLILLAGLALALVPAGAQPVAAGTGQQCDDISLSALAATYETARGEGNSPREPTLNATYKEMPASSIGKGNQLPDVVTVPVWFHVVHDNGVGNVSDAEIDQQIRIMNLGFSGAYGGVDGLPVRARRRHADGQRRVVHRRSGVLGGARDEADPASR